MKYFLRTCLIILTLASMTPAAAAQSPSVPMQRGISVQMPATSNAISVPNADKEDALVVAITQDGSTYLRTNPISPADLVKQLKADQTAQKTKVLYIKADARAPYASVVKVIDAVHAAGIEGLTLLTDQRDAGDTGKFGPPKGLEMFVAPAHGSR
jgi:biopolymer transport protein ExbD/biopolymer transport protein TolR